MIRGFFDGSNIALPEHLCSLANNLMVGICDGMMV